MSYTELHFHVLPGIDDGPRRLKESVDLARLASAEGTRTITATPHVMDGLVTDPAMLPPLVDAVNAELRKQRVPVEVLCGGELAHPMVSRLSRRQLDLIAHGPPRRRWLLLEAPLAGLAEDFSDAAADLRSRGFGILIAHPERSVAAAPHARPIIEAELARGCAVQINAWSLTGLNGPQAREHAIRLIRLAPLAVIASDAHRRNRPPSLLPALATLRSLGVTRPERFVETAPRSLLDHGIPALPVDAAA